MGRDPMRTGFEEIDSEEAPAGGLVQIIPVFEHETYRFDSQQACFTKKIVRDLLRTGFVEIEYQGRLRGSYETKKNPFLDLQTKNSALIIPLLSKIR
ncbi:hypothetical protein TNCV_4600691 [Trichonephila clavipes]|nr:hypothetical protein TNCV_4600691 [Trichonephila clavipes]